jgi:hypothetical protein
MSELVNSPERSNVFAVCLAAWLVPGLGHALYGKVRTAIVLLVVLTLMFACGLLFSGRAFPFSGSDPLALLAAAAEWGLGLPRLFAAIAGWGPGTVTAVTYEYGNTFLIVAGMLNLLAVIDVFDVGTGRKR